MHETPEDLAALQRLLDDSYAAAGSHLLEIHTPDRRLEAGRLAAALPGVRVLDLATVSSRGAPVVSPVDGLFYRGRFFFGSSRSSVRYRHIRARPQVSAAHTVGEELAVVVHGTAQEIDVSAPEHAGFRATLLEVYPDWESWYPGEPPPYWELRARRMFAYANAAQGS